MMGATVLISKLSINSFFLVADILATLEVMPALLIKRLRPVPAVLSAMILASPSNFSKSRTSSLG